MSQDKTHFSEPCRLADVLLQLEQRADLLSSFALG
jgi:hypothetical protein